MSGILIKNGRLWCGERFVFADILTEGSRIAKIGSVLENNADFIYDADGKIVSAGLVDIHTHLKGISIDDFGISAELCSIPFGVTAVNDAGAVNGNEALLDSFGVRNTVFVSTGIKNNRPVFSTAEKALHEYGKRVKGIKVYFDTTVSEVWDVTPLKTVCDYAKNKNLKVMVHCTNSPTNMVDIVKTLSSGDILTHIYHGGENNCTQNNFEALRLAKQKGVVLDTGFAGFVHTDFEIFKSAVSAGVRPDTLSTDITCCSAYKRGGRYGMTMCMNMAHAAGMREADIFKAATVAGAAVLGKENEWGSLEAGRNADIAVFDFTKESFDLTDKAGNSFKSNQGYRCVLTVFDGQIVFKD